MMILSRLPLLSPEEANRFRFNRDFDGNLVAVPVVLVLLDLFKRHV